MPDARAAEQVQDLEGREVQRVGSLIVTTTFSNPIFKRLGQIFDPGVSNTSWDNIPAYEAFH
ncbi:hypothetical protein, partial [Cereibacter changlensis]|uniref:hypothetical protein n=1 Tax=Cereibacter changlensis TaxID=402884 RepID=UPI001C637C90